MEKLAVPGSNNLNFQGYNKMFCVKKNEKEWVTFCFIKLNLKVSRK